VPIHLGSDWQNVYSIYPNDPLDIQSIANGLGFLGAYVEGSTTFTVSPD
jgi:hypothetical protein